MKKMFTVLFAGMLLLAFAGVASADHRVWEGADSNYTFAVGGQIEIDGWLQDNFSGTALTDDQIRYYNEETRIFFKGNWGGVTGMIRLEFDYDWDYDNQNKGNTTQNPLDLAYLTFPIPGTPVTVLAGLKDIKVGKVSLFVDDTFYALQAKAAFGNSDVALGTLKLNEDKVPDGNDWDAYYVSFSTKAIPNSNLLAFWITQVNDAISNDYQPWTLALVGDGVAGSLKWWGEGYYQGGSLNEDIDVSAYAVAGGFGLVAAGAELNFWGIYSSGDDKAADGELNAFLPITRPDVGSYVDGIVVDDLLADTVSNVWSVGVSAIIKPVANVSLLGRVGFYNWVEDPTILNVGDDEKYIGTEVNLVGTWKINDYLSWKLAGAYLFAGDAFEQAGDDDDLFELNNEFMVTF